MNKIIIVFVIVCLTFLTGCGKSFSMSDMSPVCNEGKYSVDSEINKQLELQGAPYSVKSINVFMDGYECKAIGVLNKPIMLLGTEVTSMPVATCQTTCIDRLQNSKIKNRTNEEITNICCE